MYFIKYVQDFLDCVLWEYLNTSILHISYVYQKFVKRWKWIFFFEYV